MAKTYTCNQTSAIAALLASALWSLAAIGTAVVTAELSPTALIVFGIMIIISWILVPLYVKLVKPAFLVGMVVIVSALIGILVMPGTPAWYSFTNPLFDFSFIVFYIIMLGGLYYSYKTYKELK